MRLLHITATHLNPAGGVPVVLKNLVDGQNNIESFTVKVVSLVAPISKIDSCYFDYVGIDDFQNYIEEFRPDFAIIHSFFYLEYNKVVDILAFNNVRYYIEPHGSFGRKAMQKSWLKKRVANSTLFRKQLKKAWGYIFLNQEEENDSVYRTPNDIIIPNGVNVSNVYREMLNKDDNALYYIGRYDIKHKGLDFLISAMKKLDKDNYGVKLKMWGKGDRKDEMKILRMLSGLKCVNVDVHPPLFGNKKASELEQFGPMILTSRYEGLPMTILEAWTYGNPCIVTPGTNMAREIEINKLGWVTELDSECIARTIKKAQKDYTDNKQFYIDKCKNYVIENYSWNKIARHSFEELNRNLGE